MLVIASRGSQLALWQARWVAGRLAALGHECRIEIIKTTGDKITDVPLAKVGGKGLFTKEIEEALLDGARRSGRPQPEGPAHRTARGPGAGRRSRARRSARRHGGQTLADLPHGAQVGTSSLRRAAQLRALRPDLQVESVRGNLDTRLRKLDEGQYRRHRAGRRRTEAPGLGRPHRGDSGARGDVPRRGPGRAGHRNARRRRAARACRRSITRPRAPPSRPNAALLARARRRLPGADRRARHAWPMATRVVCAPSSASPDGRRIVRGEICRARPPMPKRSGANSAPSLLARGRAAQSSTRFTAREAASID